MLKNIITIIFLMLLTSCGGVFQDKSPAPIDHNMKTLEMTSCGKTDVGLLGCFYDQTKEGTLEIPLWYKGEYQVRSDRCSYSLNQRFEGNTKLVLFYQDLLKDAPNTENECTYTINVFIDGFDYGFRGQFTLIKGDYKQPVFEFMNRNFVGYAGIQIREGASMTGQKLKFKADSPGVIYLDGCGISKNFPYKKDPEFLFSEIMDGYLTSAVSCILTVSLLPDDISLEGELGMITINVFDKPVIDLANPAIEYSGEKLKVTFNDKVYAAIGVKDKFVVRRNFKKLEEVISVDARPDDSIYVRMATSNGRYKLLKIKNGVIVWSNLVKF